MKKCLYFAYGSNMSFLKLKQLKVRFDLIGKVRLQDYEFVFDGKPKGRGGIYANIISKKNSYVLGGLFEIFDEDVPYLDQWEDFPVDYQKIFVEVITADKKTVKSFTYARKPLPIGKPCKTYFSFIRKGMQDCGLNKKYQQKVSRLAGFAAFLFFVFFFS